MKSLLFWGLIAAGFWAYSTGRLDSWIAQFELSDKSISEIQCEELAKVARGQTLQNVFGTSFRVLKVSSVSKVSSTNTQLTCRAKVLLDTGDQRNMTIKVKEVDGQRFYEFRSG